MNLSKHITELISYHECVIIPEFGGFISNYQSARFDSIRNTYMPPIKEVIFNSKIKKNDGLLVNHLVEAEQIGYGEAEQLVLNFVDQLFRQLNEGKKVELENIGTFEFDRTGSVIFHSANNFQLIQAYGLAQFQYSTLPEKAHLGNFKARPAVRALNNRKDVLKIAASIALVLTLSLFPVKSDKLNLHSSVLNPVEFLMEDSPMPSSKVLVKETLKPKNIESLPTNEKAPYILVGGYFQFEDNAKQFQHELNSLNFHPEIVKLENGFYRVIIDSYTSKENALDAMTTYRESHKGSGVWVSTR
ncbi:MAG: SPOR domain-containing protein [Prolixibacteraceae bacterium]